MKPTKNRVFCNNASRTKMLFETEKKADNFIKFNSKEIETANGFSPKRSYYCLFCDGWHVTSIEQDIGTSKKEHFLETHITSFYNEREQIELLTKKVETMPDNEKELFLLENIESLKKEIEVNGVSNMILTNLRKKLQTFYLVRKKFFPIPPNLNKKYLEEEAQKLNEWKSWYESKK